MKLSSSRGMWILRVSKKIERPNMKAMGKVQHLRGRQKKGAEEQPVGRGGKIYSRKGRRGFS